MHITKKDVLKISKLAKLKFNKNEESKLIDDLSQILNWVNQLKNINTKSVKPMISVHAKSMPYRKDLASDTNSIQSIIKNAPKSQSNMFVVPKVVE